MTDAPQLATFTRPVPPVPQSWLERGRHRPLPGRIPVGLLLAAHRPTPTAVQEDSR